MHKLRFLIRLGGLLILCLSLAPLTGCGFQKQHLPRQQTYVTKASDYRILTKNRHFRGGSGYYGRMPQGLDILPVSGRDGSGRSIAATAASQIGKPYVSGGISPSRGFDCSGLVYWSCRTNGIAIPRMSLDQASYGSKVSRRNLRPGDILVFKTPRGYHARSLNSNGGWNVIGCESFLNQPILQYSNEIRSAVLIVHGDKAHSCYFGRDAYADMVKDSKYTENKELLIIPGASHTDLYDGGGKGAIPFDKLESFFEENMA